MKLIPLLLAALLLGGARPLDAPALPPATLRLVAHATQPTPAVTISGVVNGHTTYGSPAPLGIYTAYGATVEEAAQNAHVLEAQITAEFAARHVVQPARP